MRTRSISLAFLVALGCTSPPTSRAVVRFATFNVSMYRDEAGQLRKDLEGGRDEQARAIAEIVQRVRPDVLLLEEFDYEPSGAALRVFERDYLGIPQGGADPIEYPFHCQGPVNTGVPSGHDLDNDDRGNGPGDAFGFGRYPGQYGMAVLSKLPIDVAGVRTFRHFPWQAMPDHRMPDGFYDPAERVVVRLSSKSHQDLPLTLPDGRVVHLLVSHPTPPVFDGPEDRNGRRNHDEIRLWADYVSAGASTYLVDDLGRSGGIAGSSFVIAGDLNADPVDGEAVEAIAQLLEHPRIRTVPVPRSRGALAASARQGGANGRQRGDPAADTGDFPDDGPGNLR
ncbi:MAG: endonuclease/exonuclease/phosphatase family protein, partial [Planctomycetes bacterium]|nr:endonuclease/exonuclease/phosphatase family protein [Planctomycetota bacterium]